MKPEDKTESTPSSTTPAETGTTPPNLIADPQATAATSPAPTLPSATTPTIATPTVITPTTVAPADTTSQADASQAATPAAYTAVQPSATASSDPVPATDSTPATGAETPAATTPPSPLPSPEQLSAIPDPTPTPAVVVATTPDMPPPKNPRKKILLFSTLGAVLVLALTAGGVFGLYLPNTPNSVWKTGLNRTGKALEQVVTTATATDTLNSYKSSEISGTADVTYDGQHFSGSFNSKFDENTSDSGLEVSFKDGEGKAAKVTAKVLTSLAKDSNYPDIYLQVSGIKALGLDSFIPSLTTYDGKWILIDSKYLESTGASFLGESDTNQKQVTSADIAAALQTATKVTNEYLFTTDSEKAVFTQDSFVGKETIDGVKTYHYKVSLDQAHATDYCVALGSAMLSTEAYKKITGSTDKAIADAQKKLPTECKDALKEELTSGDSYDLWIDKSYKLVYKVRVTDTKGSYGELGQRYTGGDSLTLFSNSHDTEGKSDSRTTITTNLQSNETSGNYSIKSTGSPSYNATVSIKAKPSSETVKFTKPSPATPIQEVMNKINSLFSGM